MRLVKPISRVPPSLPTQLIETCAIERFLHGTNCSDFYKFFLPQSRTKPEQCAGLCPLKRPKTNSQLNMIEAKKFLKRKNAFPKIYKDKGKDLTSHNYGLEILETFKQSSLRDELTQLDLCQHLQGQPYVM